MFCFIMAIETEQTIRNANQNELEQLLALIAEEDKIAFERFYRLTDKMIYGFILSILRNPYDAEDAMQDTYLRIRASAHLYQAKGKPMAWVFTIARNLCLMKIRKNKQHEESSYDLLEYEIAADSKGSVEDRMVLNQVLQTLNETERQIVILHAANGLKHREIALILDMPLPTVLSKYARSIAKLKKSVHALFI